MILRQIWCRSFANNINTFLFCLKSAKADLDMTANFGLVSNNIISRGRNEKQGNEVVDGIKRDYDVEGH